MNERSGHRNEMGGNVTGPLVQARDVHGGVHVHDGAPRLPPPGQLPAPGTLVDRAAALRALDAGRAADADRPFVAVITGPAGIGKTTLALHWAHRRLDEFADGQLYADLQGHAADEPARPAEVLGRFIRAFGIRADQVPDGLAERAALFRSLTAGRRLLVVLDDAYSAAQVLPLLPASPGSAAVVTSRWRLAGLLVRGARSVLLDPLDTAASLALLERVLGAERVGGEPEAADALVELCGRSPLALSVAAARLVTRPTRALADMVDALADERARLTELSAADRGDDVTIRAALTLSYRALPEPVALVYRMLALYPGRTFDAWTAAALTDLTVAEAGERLGVLADANLLDDLPGERYRFHELTRLHALAMTDEHDDPAVREEALRRVVDWTAHATFTASRAAAPYRRLPEPDPGRPGAETLTFTGAAEGLDWLDREFPNLRAVTRRALSAGLPHPAWRIVDAAWPLFLHRGHHGERLDFDRMGLAAARAAGDRRAEAKMLNRTGLALRALGRLEEAAADFGAALDLWAAENEPARVAGARRRLGLLDLDRGDLGSATAHLSAALQGYRSLGEDRRVALTLCDLGDVLVRGGRAAEAVRLLTEARDLLADADDPYNQARALLLLGRAGADPARVGESLRLMERIGSATGRVEALTALGDLAAAAGQPDEARRHYGAARRIQAGTGAPTRILDERLARLGP